ncbi:13563_t:CDS:2 [Ambispora gerdemannii]|uniref:13563_t:CDS:1 n=1 Tax=Ambispora gerdemannii TaxID=144530 RepID=A0A9N9AP63_9GLOM|nr:13563_t:CDS:2 [Ambispora gerdemannii]
MNYGYDSIEVDLKKDLFRHFIRAKYANSVEVSRNLITQFASDLDEISYSIWFIPNRLIYAAAAISCVIIHDFNFGQEGKINWTFLVMAFGLFVVLIIGEVLLFKKAAKLNVAAKKRQEEDNKIIYERINHLEYIKAVSGEKYEEKKVGQQLDSTFRKNKKSLLYSALFKTVPQYLIIPNIPIFFLALTLTLASPSNQGEAVFLIGNFSLYFISVKNLNGEVTKIVEALLSLDELSSSVEIVSETVKTLHLPAPLSLPVAPRPNLPFANGDIVFQKVIFAYPKRPHQNILRNFSFRFIQGQSYGIAGENGIGKSTITKTTLKLYDLKAGQVLIGERNIQEIDTTSLHQRICYQTNRPTFFHLSIAENVCYPYKYQPADLPKLVQAAQKTGIAEFIDKLPKGFDTELREGGADLSEGQKQQIAAMKMFIHDYDIYILDEILSNVHPTLKATILQNVFTQLKGIGTATSSRNTITLRSDDGTGTAAGNGVRFANVNGTVQDDTVIRAGAAGNEVKQNIIDINSYDNTVANFNANGYKKVEFDKSSGTDNHKLIDIFEETEDLIEKLEKRYAEDKLPSIGDIETDIKNLTSYYNGTVGSATAKTNYFAAPTKENAKKLIYSFVFKQEGKGVSNNGPGDHENIYKIMIDLLLGRTMEANANGITITDRGSGVAPTLGDGNLDDSPAGKANLTKIVNGDTAGATSLNKYGIKNGKYRNFEIFLSSQVIGAATGTGEVRLEYKAPSTNVAADHSAAASGRTVANIDLFADSDLFKGKNPLQCRGFLPEDIGSGLAVAGPVFTYQGQNIAANTQIDAGTGEKGSFSKYNYSQMTKFAFDLAFDTTFNINTAIKKKCNNDTERKVFIGQLTTNYLTAAVSVILKLISKIQSEKDAPPTPNKKITKADIDAARDSITYLSEEESNLKKIFNQHEAEILAGGRPLLDALKKLVKLIDQAYKDGNEVSPTEKIKDKDGKPFASTALSKAKKKDDEKEKTPEEAREALKTAINDANISSKILEKLTNADAKTIGAVNNYQKVSGTGFVDGAIKHLEDLKQTEEADTKDLLEADSLDKFNAAELVFKEKSTYKNDKAHFDKLLPRWKKAAELLGINKTDEDYKLIAELLRFNHKKYSDTDTSKISELERLKKGLESFKNAKGGKKKEILDKIGGDIKLTDIISEINEKLTKLKKIQKDKEDSEDDSGKFQ